MELPTDLHSTDFKTSITYYSGTADLDLKDTGVGDVILSGLDKADSTNTISGGNNNILPLIQMLQVVPMNFLEQFKTTLAVIPA